MQSFELTELARRVANMLRLGRVTAVDYPMALVTVDCGDLQVSDRPWLTQRAGQDMTWWAPEINEQVLVLSPQGEPEQAIVLPALYQTSSPAPAGIDTTHCTIYADGAVINYDRAGHRLSVQLPEGATAQLTATGGVSITGDVAITGNLTVSGDITDHTRSMQADRDIYNQHDHPHGDPTTDKVTQQQ